MWSRARIGRLLLVPFAIVAACALLPLACGSDDAPTLTIGEACAINSDCASPLVCAFERCHNQCESDRDCSAGERCVESTRPDRVCQLSDESTCTYSSECPGTEVCAVDDQCRDQCAEDRDCGVGQTCVSGTCADPTELDDGGLPAASGSQPVGQPCSYTSDCPSPYVCRSNGFCADECMTSRDCPGDAACGADHRCATGGMIFCVPGQEFLCTCDDMSVHHQICNPDGTAVGTCGCDGGT
ncbi:MAG TPA: hypothetical protein VGM56_17680 [Byssovorax sp.]|jgi:hypothetical protein